MWVFRMYPVRMGYTCCSNNPQTPVKIQVDLGDPQGQLFSIHLLRCPESWIVQLDNHQHFCAHQGSRKLGISEMCTCPQLLPSRRNTCHKVTPASIRPLLLKQWKTIKSTKRYQLLAIQRPNSHRQLDWTIRSVLVSEYLGAFTRRWLSSILLVQKLYNPSTHSQSTPWAPSLPVAEAQFYSWSLMLRKCRAVAYVRTWPAVSICVSSAWISLWHIN